MLSQCIVTNIISVQSDKSLDNARSEQTVKISNELVIGTNRYRATSIRREISKDNQLASR
jgi:hypothetical protein